MKTTNLKTNETRRIPNKCSEICDRDSSNPFPIYVCTPSARHPLFAPKDVEVCTTHVREPNSVAAIFLIVPGVFGQDTISDSAETVLNSRALYYVSPCPMR